MCGILLIYSKKKKLDKKKCHSALDSIKNRGPDATLKEFFLDDKLFIANTILSIVGDVKKGKKLYTSQSKRYKLSYNGEIYNYKKILKDFKKLKKSSSDTDVLANILDFKSNIDIAKLLDGMFAYCVYDNVKKLIHFNSDAQGEKKIFYYNDDDYLVCCSTVKGILSFLDEKKINVDHNQFKNYFDTRHFILFNKSAYNNIRYIEPGKSFTFNIQKNTWKSKIFDDPINWIDKKKYYLFKKNSDLFVKNYFKDVVNQIIDKILPNISFGSMMSGGIDSSIQSKALSKSKYLKKLIFIDYGKKDPTSKEISKFKKYFKNKIDIIKVNKQKYFSNLKTVYSLIKLPFFTHSLVGLNICCEYFKKNKCKVMFAGDGADELFGGYKLYEKINWRIEKNHSYSPYSNFNNFFSEKSEDTKIKSRKLWLRAFKKYNTFLPKNESKIQATLFADYFVQSVGVHNISLDFLSGENSVEVRNIFTTKTMIQNALNLPLKYKINLANKKHFRLKLILKNIFADMFNEKLIFKKQGFPGFPNESISFLNMSEKKEIKFYKKILNKSKKITKAVEWKILNCFYFKKYCHKELNIKDIIKFN